MQQIEEMRTDYADQRRSWKESVDYCRSLGADLVSIHSSEEQQAIVNFVEKRTTNSRVEFWIGLTTNGNGGYEWSDG